VSLVQSEVVGALHRAADEVPSGSQEMDTLAAAGAEFLAESNHIDEFGTPVRFDPPSLGYGIMLGYIAAKEMTS
jgi:hypothetical protein